MNIKHCFIQNFLNKKMNNPNLPQEMMIGIFSRLPTKSIGKCRCLSKRYRFLLSTPHFIELHFITSKTQQQQNLILITPSNSVTTVDNDGVPANLDLPNTFTAVVGSCDGLVLLQDDEDDIMLINPITLQRFEVPSSPVSLKRNESFTMHGFGYDSSSDDYKIVKLSYYCFQYVETFVDVYSAKMGVWKRVDCSPYNHIVAKLAPGAFVNGSIHWLASSRESGYLSVIAAFDLAKELFAEIPAPIGVDVEKFVFNKLTVLGGCLCMVIDRRNAPTYIWVMKEYGVRESWSKFGVDGDEEWDMVKALRFVGDEDEEVVLVTDEESVVVYNVEDGTMRDMVVDGAPAMAIDGCTFVESLILCPPVSNNAA